MTEISLNEQLRLIVDALPSVDELKTLPPSIQYTHLSAPHDFSFRSCCYGDSCDGGLESSCGKQNVLSCPLCPETSSTCNLNKHYFDAHWMYRLSVGQFTVYACGIRHNKLIGMHWHCPYCDQMFVVLEQYIGHVIESHPPVNAVYFAESMEADNSGWFVLSPEWTEEKEFPVPENPVLLTGGPSVLSRMQNFESSTFLRRSIRNLKRAKRTAQFSPQVSYRGFPLVCSFVEQKGCDPGERLTKPVRPIYVKQYDEKRIDEQAKDVLILGLNDSGLFKNTKFLLFGEGVPQSLIDLIIHHQGKITGAFYAEGAEWDTITHILSGPDICIQKMNRLKRTIKKVCASTQQNSNSAHLQQSHPYGLSTSTTGITSTIVSLAQSQTTTLAPPSDLGHHHMLGDPMLSIFRESQSAEMHVEAERSTVDIHHDSRATRSVEWVDAGWVIECALQNRLIESKCAPILKKPKEQQLFFTPESTPCFSEPSTPVTDVPILSRKNRRQSGVTREDFEMQMELQPSSASEEPHPYVEHENSEPRAYVAEHTSVESVVRDRPDHSLHVSDGYNSMLEAIDVNSSIDFGKVALMRRLLSDADESQSKENDQSMVRKSLVKKSGNSYRFTPIRRNRKSRTNDQIES